MKRYKRIQLVDAIRWTGEETDQLNALKDINAVSTPSTKDKSVRVVTKFKGSFDLFVGQILVVHEDGNFDILGEEEFEEEYAEV